MREQARRSGGAARVVIVTSSYPRATGDPAGRVVAVEAERLAALGAEVHVLAPGRASPARDYRAQQTNEARGARAESTAAALGAERPYVHRVGSDELFRWPGALSRLRERPSRAAVLPGWFWRVTRAFDEIAEKGPIDRVIAHWLLPCGFPLAFWLTRRPRLRVGASCGVERGASKRWKAVDPRPISASTAPELELVLHGTDVRCFVALPRPMRAVIAAALVERGARFRFVADSLRAALMRSLPASLAERLQRQSTVEPPPLALGQAALDRARRRGAELREALALEPGCPLWVSCGRLLADKRIELAVQRATGVGASLVIVGDGPHRRVLERAARDRRADRARVQFAGQVDHDDALAWIAAADRLVVFSRAEGAPSVVREARALGTRVLASRSAGDVAHWAASDAGIEIVDE